MRVIWINGPFGIGKTTLALRLADSLDAPIFDPEEFGFVLRASVKVSHGDDFQNLVSWQQAVTAAMSGLLADGHRDVVVPMTVHRPDIRAALRDGFAAFGVGQLVEIVLVAPIDELLSRLASRPSTEQAIAWATAQAETSLVAFAQDGGDIRVETAGMDPDQVHDLVLARLR